MGPQGSGSLEIVTVEGSRLRTHFHAVVSQLVPVARAAPARARVGLTRALLPASALNTTTPIQHQTSTLRAGQSRLARTTSVQPPAPPAAQVVATPALPADFERADAAAFVGGHPSRVEASLVSPAAVGAAQRAEVGIEHGSKPVTHVKT